MNNAVDLSRVAAEKIDADSEFKLSEKHQEVAKQIVKKHITKRYLKKGCKECGLTGIKYITTENLVMPCNCVNVFPAREEWAEYCKQFPELKKRFLEV